MKFCPECGSKVLGGGTFCSECGFNLSKVTGPGASPPSETDAKLAKAKTAMGSGDLRSALAMLEELIEKDGKDPRVWNNKGMVHSKMGQYQKAVESYDRALALDVSNPHIWYGKGAALVNLEKYSEAREALEKTLELDPGDTRARGKLAQCEAAAGGNGGKPAGEASEEPCPICNSKMRYWDGNWWCDMCNVYPFLEDSASSVHSAPTCAQCGGPLRFIEKYGRQWCNTCRKYEPRAGSTGFASAPSGGGTCPTCAGRLRFIQQYGRYWCDNCRKYG